MEEYTAKLQAMTDDELVKEAENQVWHSAFASNNSRAPSHRKCDATYDEAKRREKLWLYCRGWNAAFESCGHTLSDSDRKAAMEPVA